MRLKIFSNYSPNFNSIKRKTTQIKFLIFHYTGMKKEAIAIKKLTSLGSDVSCHYFIKKNGETINLVPDLYEAWHAGKSSWKNPNLNDFDRPLGKRGIKELPIVMDSFSNYIIENTKVICSSSLRTMQTYNIVKDFMPPHETVSLKDL